MLPNGWDPTNYSTLPTILIETRHGPTPCARFGNGKTLPKSKRNIEQKLERIYQLANHRVSPRREPPQPSLRPLTRAERQAVLEISEVLGINLHGETQKTNQRRLHFK